MLFLAIEVEVIYTQCAEKFFIMRFWLLRSDKFFRPTPLLIKSDQVENTCSKFEIFHALLSTTI